MPEENSGKPADKVIEFFKNNPEMLGNIVNIVGSIADIAGNAGAISRMLGPLIVLAIGVVLICGYTYKIAIWWRWIIVVIIIGLMTAIPGPFHVAASLPMNIPVFILQGYIFYDYLEIYKWFK